MGSLALLPRFCLFVCLFVPPPSMPSFALDLQRLNTAILNWFQRIPLLILFTKFSDFDPDTISSVFPDYRPGHHGDPKEDGIVFLARKSLAVVRQFSYSKVRLLCSERDKLRSQYVKRIDESNAIDMFADTVRKLNQKA
eukprot:c4089_g1_i2.p1 GENE.c4089_g1_i2~~c4089_g1_i2.p1  ORF type:complete len:139 (-),score=31.45 c4089_g1_i2:77-493(-)